MNLVPCDSFIVRRAPRLRVASRSVSVLADAREHLGFAIDQFECRGAMVGVAQGALFIASPEIPSPAMTEALQGFTRLELRMHLVPAPEFDSLSAALL